MMLCPSLATLVSLLFAIQSYDGRLANHLPLNRRSTDSVHMSLRLNDLLVFGSTACIMA